MNTSSAEDALTWIVPIEGIGHIHFIWLGPEGSLLMLNFEKARSVVYRTVAIIVVADGAVEKVIAENSIEGFTLSRLRSRGCGLDVNAIGGRCCASSHELAVHLNHAGIAGLDGTELGVVTDLRDVDPAAIDCVNQALCRIGLKGRVIQDD